ncbi:MAG: helix-turn-helix transcriptional regulator [Desulfuromonadaceae bacterium]|nr:helix-turn-helix transcriptional regulator [Desulfuromonadaceae bacterium]
MAARPKVGGGKTPVRVVELLQVAVNKTSQAATARALGLTLKGVQNYIKGIGEPNAATLTKVADYFNVDVDWLRVNEIPNELITTKLLDKYFSFINSLKTNKLRKLGLHFSSLWFKNVHCDLVIIHNFGDERKREELRPYMQACEDLEMEHIRWSKKTGGLLGDEPDYEKQQSDEVDSKNGQAVNYDNEQQ